LYISESKYYGTQYNIHYKQIHYINVKNIYISYSNGYSYYRRKYLNNFHYNTTTILLDDSYDYLINKKTKKPYNCSIIAVDSDYNNDTQNFYSYKSRNINNFFSYENLHGSNKLIKYTFLNKFYEKDTSLINLDLYSYWNTNETYYKKINCLYYKDTSSYLLEDDINKVKIINNKVYFTKEMYENYKLKHLCNIHCDCIHECPLHKSCYDRCFENEYEYDKYLSDTLCHCSRACESNSICYKLLKYINEYRCDCYSTSECIGHKIIYNHNCHKINSRLKHYDL
jgi:hypothetical protein